MKHIRPYKLKSGALQLTVFIGVIIALILAGLLLLGYTHRSLTNRSKLGVAVIRSCDDGIGYLCATSPVSSDTITLRQPEEGVVEKPVIKMHLSYWGIYPKAIVTSTQRNKKFTKAALLGSTAKGERVALFLQETYKPLVVAGSTQIRGKAILPKMGIKPGYIAGNSFYGNELLDGAIGVSSETFPVLQADLQQQSTYYMEEYHPVTASEFVTLHEKRLERNSFTAGTKGYSSEQPVVLSDVKLQGNIIIRSAMSIRVERSAHLNDVILAAPVVELEDGVEGNFQVFASRSIICRKNCRLDYPSVLVLTPKTQLQDEPFDRNRNKIIIEENSMIKGVVAYTSPNDDKGYRPNIFIDPKATVAGELYCKGNLELRGTIYGTVYAKQLVVNEGGTVYLNHLYNAIIDVQKLPEQYVGLVFEDKLKDVLKWLY